MKKLKLFFALFAMLALGVGNAWAEASFTIKFKDNGSDASTALTATTFTNQVAEGVELIKSVSTSYCYPGTGGLKCSSNKNNGTFTLTLNNSYTISKIVLSVKNKNATTKTVKVGNTSFSTSDSWNTTSFEDLAFTGTETTSDQITVSLAGTTNSKRVAYIASMTVYYKTDEPGTEEPVLTSIEISGDLTNKTYEEGEDLDLAGLIVTAKYDDNSEEDVTKDVEWSYEPLTAGQTSVTVTATYEEQTANKTIEGLTVNEHIITPGEYKLLLNNVFFGTTAGTNVSSFPTSAKQDDITVTLNGSGTKTRTDAANVRMYSGNTLTFSVPVGYLITSITFTEPSSSTQWDGKITVNSGDYDETNKSWSGLAQDVVFTFGAQNRIAEAIVTYVADVKSTLTIETPQNGTISVKNGTTEVTSGTQLSAGTSLVVTPTPASGYLFESLTVDGSEVELSEGKYTFTMPENDVIISATFKENEKPAATLTLSKNGETELLPGNHKQDDVVILPDFESDCSKTFVGWDADENCNHAPTYAPGAEYTLAAETQTLYAVYADGEGGGNFTITKTMSEIVSDNGYTVSSGNTATCYTSLTLDENITLSTTGSANCGSFWNDPREWRLYQNKSGNAIVTATNGCSLTSVKFTFTNSNTGTLLNNGASMTSGTAVSASGTSATYTVGNSGSATNGQIRITAIEVSYSKEGEYSNYSTTCVAALDEPVFSVEGGENEAKTITLTATEGTIYYTLDGTTPTASSEKYTTPIVLDECGETTIKAIAISAESKSPVVSATYTINLPITNTAATAYTPAEAIAIIDGACDKSEEVYVKGVVVSTSEFDATYGNYDVIVKAVDDNSATPTTFTFYHMYKAASNTKFIESDEVIGVGDIITAKGKLTKFYSTYEFEAGCYMVERIAFTDPKTDISNTEETAYTVDKAFELISDIKSDLDKEVYVKGIVAVASTQLYEEKYLTYSISDNGQNTGNVLKVYDGLDIGGVAFTNKDDVKVGDYVVVKGKLFNYGGTYEINKDNQLVQHVKAATITIADITMEVGETKTIEPTITPAAAETAVKYTIKENAANAISLSGNVITANAVGTATITATIATAADYMGNTVDFTVTVTPESASDEVVILAEHNGQWYALKAEDLNGDKKILAALAVTYLNGKLYNVNETDKASITWTRTIVGDQVTFKNGTNYIYVANPAKTELSLNETAFSWTYDAVLDTYTSNDGKRTFLYGSEANGFKNFAINNNVGTKNYSGYPVVTAPVYATADLILGDVNDGATVEAHNGQVVDVVVKRSLTANDGWYTLCLPFNLPQAQLSKIGKAYTIPTDASKYTCKDGVITVNVEQVTQLNARMPYLIMPTANIEGFVAENVTIAYEDGSEGVVNIYGISDGNGADYNFSMTSELYVGGTERTNGLYWVGNGGYLYNNDVQKLALRAYFSITQAGGNGMPPRFRVVAGENVETGVGNIISGENTAIKVIENGQLIIIRDGVKYNVQGQKL